MALPDTFETLSPSSRDPLHCALANVVPVFVLSCDKQVPARLSLACVRASLFPCQFRGVPSSSESLLLPQTRAFLDRLWFPAETP